jgi:hypothetical protein
MDAKWYLRRLSRMTPAEAGRRLRDAELKRRWRSRMGKAPPTADARVAGFAFAGLLPSGPQLAETAGPDAARRLVDEAEAILAGHLSVFGHEVRMADGVPDWFTDPLTERRGDPSAFAFDIDHRNEAEVGNIKFVWEAARHQYLPRLAMAWRLTGDLRFAERIEADLRNFWRRNPFLTGIHWTSGIEIAIRLISWAWTRRLLDGWDGAPGLFERNPAFVAQLRAHQDWLAALPSHGSSANNHLIAEAAGAFVAAAAFPLFPESARRRDDAAETLARELARQTFTDGLNRELATEYHAFVAELAMAAMVEGDAQGCSFDEETWSLLAAMFDTAAALLDVAGRPPRQGDADEGLGLPIDPVADEAGRWASLLAAGDVLVGRMPWWPETRPDLRAAALGAICGRRFVVGRPARRPSQFADAGLVILRDHERRADELWCRLDSGPHGYLAIAAHGHADALSIELRHGGVDVLADPGTYCYHGEREWRRYFRSTIGHNTLELAGMDQAIDGGPFLWLRAPRSRLEEAHGVTHGTVGEWRAVHDGYARLRPSALHQRTIRLDRGERVVEIEDRLIGGAHPARLAFHLGPEIDCSLNGARAVLVWTGPAGSWRAIMQLPPSLAWSLHAGETDPPLGWYSPGFGHKTPAATLIGQGQAGADQPLVTVLRFEPEETR